MSDLNLVREMEIELKSALDTDKTCRSKRNDLLARKVPAAPTGIQKFRFL